MDSRDPNHPPPQNHHHHHHHQYENHPYSNHHTTNSIHNNRFPFNSAQPTSPKPSDSLNYGFESPSSASSAAKKKRGRPRKYAPEGNIALGLAPTTSISPPPPATSNTGGAMALVSIPVGGGNSENALSSDAPAKRNRGRPPGSGKKQLDALGSSGVGFTPHVIMVNPGEDIVSKIMAFSQQGPRTVCILSANGSISSVVLRQPSMSGGNVSFEVSGGDVSFEGRFEIISLSGSFSLSESSGPHSRTGGLSVSLAGPDGRVLGGGVSGQLVAASPVQVIVGSFIADGKKQNSNLLRSPPSSSAAPPATQSNMLTFGTQTGSPPSQPGSSDSSDGNESSQFNRNPGPYGTLPQPLHTMPAYTPMGGWPNSTMKNAS